MDFNRSDLQRMLLDSAERFVGEHYSLEHRRGLRETADGLDTEAWETFAELGWLAILVPEEMGGLDGTMADAATLGEVLGSRCVSEPFVSSAVIAPTILAGATASQDELLGDIVGGAARIALAHDEPDERYAFDAPRKVSLSPSGNGFELSGQKMLVLDAPSATHAIVTADGANGLALVLVALDADGITTDAYPFYDGSRAADIAFEQTQVTPDAVLAEGEAAHILLSLALDRGRAVAQAQVVGSMEAELEICSAYLKEREQFGQKIGNFQSLQHIMADMFVEAHQARSALYFALSKFDGGADANERARAVALAGLRIGEAAQLVGRQAIQLHGGYGVTDEYEVSHHYRRQFVLEKSLGDLDYLARLLAAC